LSTTTTGHHAMPIWMGAFGDLARISIEGTGLYGASGPLPWRQRCHILEVDRIGSSRIGAANARTTTPAR
jgi:hypothetical protein